MHTPTVVSITACAILAAPAVAFQQQKSEPVEIQIAWGAYAPRSQYTFRTGTTVVDVPVVVRDKSKQPVGGLQRGDFEIYDSGKKREIASFSVQTAAGRAEVPARTRYIALVFNDAFLDYLCTGSALKPFVFGPFVHATKAAERFVNEGIAPGDRVSIFGTWSGQIVPFTTDPAKLQAGLKQLTVHSACQGQLDQLGVLADIVKYVGRMPGSRSVVLTGLPIGGQRMFQELTVRRALDANVAINALSAEGVSPRSLSYSTMRYLADATGGLSFYNSNDLAKGFRRLSAAPEVSYLIGFVPDSVEDGRYHKLRVRVPGGSGYSVQARPGYYAPEKGASEKQEPEQAIERLVSTREVRNEVPAELTVLPDRLTNGAPAVMAVAHVDIKRLPFRTVEDRRTQRLTWIAALLDDAGNVVIGKKGIIGFALKERSHNALSTNGLNATFVLEAPAGKYWLRSVVEEDLNGKMSAAPLTPITIPEID